MPSQDFFGTCYSHFDIFTFHVFVSGRRKLPQAPCAVQIQCLGGLRLAWVGDVRHISKRFKYGFGWKFHLQRPGVDHDKSDKLNIRTFNDGPWWTMLMSGTWYPAVSPPILRSCRHGPSAHVAPGFWTTPSEDRHGIECFVEAAVWPYGGQNWMTQNWLLFCSSFFTPKP